VLDQLNISVDNRTTLLQQLNPAAGYATTRVGLRDNDVH
jgi:hypothetical protein